VSRLAVHRYGPPIRPDSPPIDADPPPIDADPPPILAIHGVQGHGRRFRRLAEETLSGRTVLAPDLRGHGDSTWDPPWDGATHVDDLLETLDAEGVERVDVVGHSFGGLLATRLAASAPTRIRRMVLLDPAVALPPARMSAEAETTRHDEGWANRDEALAARSADRTPQAMPHVLEDLEVHLDQGADGRFRLRFSRPAVVAGWSEIARPAVSLAGWPGRALLVIGETGDYVMPWFRAALARDLGERLTERTIVSGHMVLWDALDETGALVRAFLAGPGAE
jgi:lipase